MPTAADNVTVAASHTVTVNAAAAVSTLVVQGTLRFFTTSPTLPSFLTVAGAVNVLGGRIQADNLPAPGNTYFKAASAVPIPFFFQDGSSTVSTVVGLSNVAPFAGTGQIFPTSSSQGSFSLSGSLVYQDEDLLLPINGNGAERRVAVRGEVGFAVPSVTNTGAGLVTFEAELAPVNLVLQSGLSYEFVAFSAKNKLTFSGVDRSLQCDSVVTSTGAGVVNISQSFYLAPKLVSGSFVGAGVLRAHKAVNVTKLASLDYRPTLQGGFYVEGTVELQLVSGNSFIYGPVVINSPEKHVLIRDTRILGTDPLFVRSFYGQTVTISGKVELVDGARVATSQTTLDVPIIGNGQVNLVADPQNLLPYDFNCGGRFSGGASFPEGVRFQIINAEAPPQMPCTWTGIATLPVVGKLRLLPFDFSTGGFYLNNFTWDGTITFADVDARSRQQVAYTGAYGHVILTGSPSIGTTCRIVTEANASSASSTQQGLLEFLLPSQGLFVPFSRCAVSGVNSTFYLKFAEPQFRRKEVAAPNTFSLPPNLQVGMLHLNGRVNVIADFNVTIVNMFAKLFIGNNPLVSSELFSPNLKLDQVGSTLVLRQNVVMNVMGNVEFTGATDFSLNLAGYNSRITAHSFQVLGDAGNITMTWGDYCTPFSSANSFPRLEAVGNTWCGSGSCFQTRSDWSNVRFRLIMSRMPFVGNVTFAIIDDPNDDVQFAGVEFLQTGGLTYTYGYNRVSVLIGNTVHFYRHYYFYSTSSFIPTYFGCGRPECEQLDMGEGQVVNTCDGPRDIRMRIPVIISSSMSVASMTIENGVDAEWRQGATLTVLRELVLKQGCTMRFLQGARAVVGTDVTIGGNVSFAAGATFVSGTVTFLPGAQYFLERDASNTVPIRSTGQVTFAGTLLLQFTAQFFASAQRNGRMSLREIVQSTAVVPVASYSSSSGSFSAVQIESANYSGSQCDTYSTKTVQSSQTLSVVVDVTRDTSVPGCAVASSSGGLPVGAIVGIAVGGAALCAVLVVVLVILCRKRELAKQNAAFMSNAYEKDRQRMSGMPN